MIDRPLPRRALVTGGAGFVGHAVVAALARRGVAVTVLDPGPPHPRWPAGVRHARAAVGGEAGGALLREVAGEGRDGLAQKRPVDVIFHVAGLWDGRPGGDARMRALNVEGTRAVLATGVPVVYTSSSITCGYGEARPGTEDEPSEDPRRPLRGTPKVYRETKLAAEALVAAAGGVIVNPDYVVGPGDVGGVVMGPLFRAARLPVIPAPRGGKCFVGVDDVGEGHVLAWLRGAPGRRYLLGAENRTYADVIGTIARLAGRRPRFVPLPDAVVHVAARLPGIAPLAGALEQMAAVRWRSGERARSELGWAPGAVDRALAEAVAEGRARHR